MRNPWNYSWKNLTFGENAGGIPEKNPERILEIKSSMIYLDNLSRNPLNNAWRNLMINSWRSSWKNNSWEQLRKIPRENSWKNTWKNSQRIAREMLQGLPGRILERLPWGIFGNIPEGLSWCTSEWIPRAFLMHFQYVFLDEFLEELLK